MCYIKAVVKFGLGLASCAGIINLIKAAGMDKSKLAKFFILQTFKKLKWNKLTPDLWKFSKSIMNQLKSLFMNLINKLR